MIQTKLLTDRMLDHDGLWVDIDACWNLCSSSLTSNDFSNYHSSVWEDLDYGDFT